MSSNNVGLWTQVAFSENFPLSEAKNKELFPACVRACLCPSLLLFFPFADVHQQMHLYVRHYPFTAGAAPEIVVKQ